MRDRLDDRIRAFVVELVDDPPEAPPFPPEGPEQSRKHARRLPRAASVVTATLLTVLFLGVIPLLVDGGNPADVVQAGSASDAVEILATAVNDRDITRVEAILADDATCLIAAAPGNLRQKCKDLFGFFIESGTEMSLGSCVPFGNRYTCLGSIHNEVHQALGIPPERPAQMNPTIQFEEGQITEFRIINPFTGNTGLDNDLWDHLQDVGASYIGERGVPIFTPDMVDEFIHHASDFAALQG